MRFLIQATSYKTLSSKLKGGRDMRDMLLRFNELARQAVSFAQDEARALKHNYIGTEHLLLGLIREEGGIAAQVLEYFDITLEEVRTQLAHIVGQGDEVLTTGPLPYTPRTKKIFELALREALSLGHNYIGTEHLLLGLIREKEGVAANILFRLNADPEKIKTEIINTLKNPETRRRAAGKYQLRSQLSQLESTLTVQCALGLVDPEDERVLRGHIDRIRRRAKRAKGGSLI